VAQTNAQGATRNKHCVIERQTHAGSNKEQEKTHCAIERQTQKTCLYQSFEKRHVYTNLDMIEIDAYRIGKTIL
jgi:hypothetical protein